MFDDDAYRRVEKKNERFAYESQRAWMVERSRVSFLRDWLWGERKIIIK